MRLLLRNIPENIDRMCDAMTAFNLLMKVHKVQSYRAFATLCYEAYGQEIVALIKEKSDVNIEIIDGKKGGGNYCFYWITSLIKNKIKTIFVDVGGSTEFTIFSNGKIIISFFQREQCVY
jgi:exopolyphosphatase/guanosine-5'-triphosphate,3'-diphosphate pyrophosphatase